MAHVLLPCDLPSWPSVRRHLALLKTCKDGKQLAVAMDTIFDMCSVSLDPDDAALPLEGHPGNSDFGHFVDEVLSESERGRFMCDTLPKLAARAAELKRPPAGFLYSLRKEEGEFRVSRPMVSSLLANAFFSTFPKRNTKTHPTLQDFRMADFFTHLLYKRSHQKKLKAFLRYFENLDSDPGGGDLIFTRKVVNGPSLPWWLCSDRPLVPLVLRQEGGVLDAEPHMYKAYSCSPLIGGDVLKASTSKEARLFFSFPELLVLLSFVESLADDEALVAENPGQPGLCFLDSSQFSSDRPFGDSFLLRELNKALAVFQHTKQQTANNFQETSAGMRRVSASSHLSTREQDDPRPTFKTHHKWPSSQHSSRSSMRTASQTSVEPLLRDDFYTADEDSEEGSKMEGDVSRSDSLGFVLGASEDSSLPVHERLDDFRRRIRKRTRRRLSRRSSRSLTSSGSSDMEDISEDILSEGISEEEEETNDRWKGTMRPTSSEPSIVSAVAESASACHRAPLSQVAELLSTCAQKGQKKMMVTSSNGHLKAYSYDGVNPNLPVPFRASFRRRRRHRSEEGGGRRTDEELEDALPPSVSRRCSMDDEEQWTEDRTHSSVAVEPLEEGRADSQLRVTLLWLAASMADLRALVLYTAGHSQMKEVVRVHSRVLSRQWTVGDLSCEVLRFCRNSSSALAPQLFSQIIGRPNPQSSMSQESLD